MYQDVERLLQLIGEGNPFQAQYIEKMKREGMQKREFDNLAFLVQFFSAQGITVEQQAQAYLEIGCGMGINLLHTMQMTHARRCGAKGTPNYHCAAAEKEALTC